MEKIIRIGNLNSLLDEFANAVHEYGKYEEGHLIANHKKIVEIRATITKSMLQWLNANPPSNIPTDPSLNRL